MRENRGDGWRKPKLFAGLAVLAFAATLAQIVGNRLSDEALSVLVGAVCGVGAAIPTSLLVVSVSRRREDSQRTDLLHPAPRRDSCYPPVVVVTPLSWQRRSEGWNSARQLPHVVGWESVPTTWLDERTMGENDEIPC